MSDLTVTLLSSKLLCTGHIASVEIHMLLLQNFCILPIFPSVSTSQLNPAGEFWRQIFKAFSMFFQCRIQKHWNFNVDQNFNDCRNFNAFRWRSKYSYVFQCFFNDRQNFDNDSTFNQMPTGKASRMNSKVHSLLRVRFCLHLAVFV